MTYHISHTPQQLQGIYSLDQLLLGKAPFSFGISSGKTTEMRCICPYCDGLHSGKAKDRTRKVTGSIFKHKNGEGYCFKCIACKEFRNSMYLLAKETFPNGEAVADWYATYRWERLDRAAGHGWSCPLPKKVAKSFAEARANKSMSKKASAAAKVAADMFLPPRNNTQA